MKNYKIQILETTKYIIDVKAESEEEAKKKADDVWQDICNVGTNHYYMQDDPDCETVVGTIYDVTGTDDAPQDTCDGKHDNVQAILECEVCTNSSLLKN